MKFKIGDRVKVITIFIHHANQIGRIYNIDLKMTWPIYVKFDNDDVAPFREDELKIANSVIIKKCLGII